MLFTKLALITWALTSAAFSAEVDQFTNREAPLADSSAIINQKANLALKDALKNLNSEKSGCDEELLYKKLRTYYGNHLNGSFTKEVIKSDEIQKRAIAIPDSVYRDWGFFDGTILNYKPLQQTDSPISALIRVGDHVIGTDKFEHMFGRGWVYFTKNYTKGKGVQSALDAGIFGEKFELGGLRVETGVFSYGDLSANFNGMRFWNHVLQNNDDVLGVEYNAGPFVACKNNQWVTAKPIDFKNYIDDAFDESINCSKFATEEGLASFTKNIEAMGDTCPMDREKLSVVTQKYGKLSKWLINQDGNGVVKLMSEFKNK